MSLINFLIKKIDFLLIVIFVFLLSNSLLKGKPDYAKKTNKYKTVSSSLLSNKSASIISTSNYSDIYFKLILGSKQKKQKVYNSDAFFQTGTGHLLSISGLHIGGIILSISLILNILLMIFLKKIKIEHFPKMFISAPLSIIIVFLYIHYIGLEIPRLRALIMAIMLFSCFAFNFFKNKLRVILVSASITILMFPNAAHSYSFYYSFLAVSSIFLASKKNILSISILIFIFLLPLNIHLNSSINLFEIIINTIIVPVFCIVYFPLVAVLYLIMLILSINTLFFMDLLTFILLYILKILSKINFALKINLLSLNVQEVLFLYLIIIFFYILIKESKYINKHNIKKIYFCIFIISIFFAIYFVKSYSQKNYIQVFNLIKPYRINGSGDTILLKTGGNIFLIDTGFGGFSTKKTINKLLQKKINLIDYLIITHEDIDHIGGLWHFLNTEQIKISNIITSNRTYEWIKSKKQQEQKNILLPPVLLACSDTIIKINNKINDKKKNADFILKFINPICNAKQFKIKKNDAVLAFILFNKNIDIYFFSDITKKYFKKIYPKILLSRQVNHKKMLMQMPHHCSLKDNPVPFISKLNPTLGFCTRSPYVKGNYIQSKDTGFPVFNTAVKGDIFIEF